MKKTLFTLATSVGLAAIVIFAYYFNEVHVARAETPALVAEAWKRHGKNITHSDLTSDRLRFLLSVEDPEFFYHKGVDLATYGAGMTTITQGLVKLLYYPDGFRQGIAKIRQTLIAQYALDAMISKEEQLDLLLNIAYLGNSNDETVIGFATAAQRYFGKDFRALSENEFKSLVAMLIAPTILIPGSAAHAERMSRIEAFVSGAYHPLCVLDTEYNGRRRGTVAEEALMIVLRLITDATPRPH